jgi:ABC-type antimicrobial peptide transport system permease subunit
MDSLTRRSLAQPGFATGLAASLALLALALTVVGTYGLSSYAVAQRQREIGIRLALGAEPGRVIRMVLRDGLVFALAGLAFGIPIAVISGGIVRRTLPGLSSLDPALLLASATALVLTITAACWIPARRASRVSPSEPLRAE